MIDGVNVYADRTSIVLSDKVVFHQTLFTLFENKIICYFVFFAL